MVARDGFSLIELAMIVVIIGILAAISVPNYLAMQARAKESEVMALAHVVQTAVEDHAAQTDGVYSQRPEDIVPNLPNGTLQENPWTGEFTEPRFGMVAAAPGQVGFVVVMMGDVGIGYTITGFGRTEEVISYTTGR